MSDLFLKNFGNNLRKYRHKANITQEKLAEIVGIHPTYVGKLECGKNNPSTVMLYKITRALNITFVDIFDFDKKIDL